MKKLILAVAYLRMSSDDQKDSIDQQRREIREFAEANGYKIVREYVDEGKSGSREQEKRLAFQQMLLDATSGEFQAVLCWDAARFARLDNIDGAFAKQILRQNGIHLHTVKEGPFDWQTVEGRWKDVAFFESAKAHSLNISKDSLRGRTRTLEAGFWPNGSIPYGFDREYIFGGQTIFVRRQDQFRKPKGCQLKLKECEAEAAIVRRIFSDYVDRAKSLRRIAIDLNAEGVQSPDGNQWNSQTIKGMLRNKSYIGYGHIGVRYGGKKRRKDQFNAAQPSEKAECCPALVDVRTWQQAQKRLDASKGGKVRQQSSRAAPLSGVLFCGHCGCRLVKKHQTTAAGVIHHYYVCKSFQYGGACRCQRTVREDALLPEIVRKLVATVDEELLATINSKPTEPVSNVAILEKQLAELRVRYERATKRYLAIDDDRHAEAAHAEMNRLRDDIDGTEERLAVLSKIENEGGVSEFKEWWTETKGEMVAAIGDPPFAIDGGRDLKSKGKAPGNAQDGGRGPQMPKMIFAPSDAFRGFLSKLGLRVTCFWKQNAKRPINQVLDRAKMKIDIEWHSGKTSESAMSLVEGGRC